MIYINLEIVVDNLFILGAYPNSKRQIEPELLRIIMKNWKIEDLKNFQVKFFSNFIISKGLGLNTFYSNNKELDNYNLFQSLKLLQTRPTVGSLSLNDKYELDELYKFFQITQHICSETIIGCEPFPGELLNPKKLNVTLPENVY